MKNGATAAPSGWPAVCLQALCHYGATRASGRGAGSWSAPAGTARPRSDRDRNRSVPEMGSEYARVTCDVSPVSA